MLILRYTEKGSQGRFQKFLSVDLKMIPLSVGYAISSTLGRIYSITLLYNLNGRPMKQDTQSVVTSGDLTDSLHLSTLRE